MIPTQAIILAAGFGTRLKWMRQDKPKALVEVAGIPLIVHVLRRLQRQGIAYVVINTHYQSEKLKAVVGDGSAFGMHIRISEEETILDAGGGVCQALQVLPSADPVLVHNVDVWSDIRLQDFDCPPAGACLALTANPAHNPEGDFSLQHTQVMPKHTDQASWTFCGVAVFDPQVFTAYSAGQSFSMMRVFLDLMQQQRLHGYVHQGEWFDLGRPRDIIQTNLRRFYAR
ncbi:MAG: nucleotidyltransferase family protein [Mariprofundaceae bacterium]|nr:nucleotidyltransferase family protein [Mariprofundaceae bacterium]